MAKSRAKKTSGGGRGSAEAIQKRRAARQLNTLFTEGGKVQTGLDGRTEKRRQRLLKELREGRRGKPLKAIEVLQHTHELLDIGESLTSIRKTGYKAPKVSLDEQDRVVVERTQAAYNFHPDAWRVLGVELEGSGGEPPAPKKKARRSRKKA
ncbi:MAG: hypothetical protein ACFCGT_15420 [Sandaracinaceae bacterium]